MLKRVLTIFLIIAIIIGVWFGLSISIKRNIHGDKTKISENNIINKIQVKAAEATACYTYGKAFNINGKITNVSKDNFEGLKLLITDGLEFERACTVNYDFEENNLIFSSDKEINSGILLDELETGEYYILLRLKLNNSAEPKYYSLKNGNTCQSFEYYTVTQNETNKKVNLEFVSKNNNGNEYSLLKLNVEEAELPSDVYDIVIDAGHGGKDKGENAGDVTEADITLEYSKSLKQELENVGYRVKLTRDDLNSESFTSTNMYDSNGRITIACQSKAKLMISFHVNQGNSGLKGFEIYSPSKANLDFAKNMSKKIKENVNLIEYSNNNSFKMADGVYVRNFTKSVINDYTKTANSKGYEPYNITYDTPFLYTIRETGGIATGAYVDGRNTAYAANKYYNSNQGIECYQIELGYIKNDLEVIQNEMTNYVKSIATAITENY